MNAEDSAPDSPGVIHDCGDADIVPVDHPENAVDWSNSQGSQSYQVYKCRVCGDYWGIRHQYDGGTGRDDRPHRFGSNPDVIVRHY